MVFPIALPVCPGAELTGITDRNGTTVIPLEAGGCLEAPRACVITANGIIIREYDIVHSPDWDGAEGDLDANLAAYIPRHHCP